MFRTAHRVVWTVAGTLVPLTLLCATSAGLVAVLYRSRKAAVASPRRYPCTRVTVTVAMATDRHHGDCDRHQCGVDVHRTCLSVDDTRGQSVAIFSTYNCVGCVCVSQWRR